MRMTLLSFTLLFLSCTSKKEYIDLQHNPITITTACPENGKCEVTIHPDKTIVLTTTESGDVYYALEESKDKIVIVYTYNKTVPKDVMDASYREEIIFELTKSIGPMEISNAGLSQTKMLFGRFCFCKGATGYYNIRSGKLKTANLNGETAIDLNFHISEVPQIIENIGFTIK